MLLSTLTSNFLPYSINLSPNVFIGETFEHMFLAKVKITNKQINSNVQFPKYFVAETDPQRTFLSIRFVLGIRDLQFVIYS